MSDINKIFEFEAIECCNCHCIFCVTKEHKQNLIDTKIDFYCPNGHRQSYTGKSNEQVIKELNEKINVCSINRNILNNELKKKIEELDKQKKTSKAYKLLFQREKKKRISKQDLKK